jgi:hypothetical protein
LGASLVYKLNNAILEKVAEISHEGCRKAVFEGMFGGLVEERKEKKALQPEVAQFIAETLSREDSPIPVDNYRFIEWIRAVDKQLEQEPEDNEWLIPYFVALFPVLKDTTYSSPGSLFETPHDSGTPHSILARRVAERAGFLPWRNHIAKLEAQLPTYVQGTKNASFLHHCLHLYVNRPLPQKLRQEILQKLTELPASLKSEWIDLPLCYKPIDEVEIHVIGPEEFVIFYEEDRDPIREFFTATGCKAILLNRIEQEKEKLLRVALRWAIITQDDEIFRAILPICQVGRFGEEDSLELYELTLRKQAKFD